MSKIVFFCIPAHGHTNPTLPRQPDPKSPARPLKDPRCSHCGGGAPWEARTASPFFQL